MDLIISFLIDLALHVTETPTFVAEGKTTTPLCSERREATAGGWSLYGA